METNKTKKCICSGLGVTFRGKDVIYCAACIERFKSEIKKVVKKNPYKSSIEFMQSESDLQFDLENDEYKQTKRERS